MPADTDYFEGLRIDGSSDRIPDERSGLAHYKDKIDSSRILEDLKLIKENILSFQPIRKNVDKPRQFKPNNDNP
jgi:hypothetical protein